VHAGLRSRAEKYPTAQASQVVAPRELAEPAAQSEQPAEPFTALKVPAAQTAQERAPGSGLARPAAQSKHWFVLPPCLPAAHAAQAVAPDALTDATGQGVQVPEPFTAEKNPGVQMEQLDSPMPLA
jgi:hypothetical protein